MKLIVILLSFFAINAQAISKAEISLESEGVRAQPPLVDTKFAADRELGRAWIVLAVKDRVSAENNGAPVETVKVRVEGLAFDPATGNITYENGGEKTVCATQKRFLASRFYKKTKNCQINVSFDKRKFDDGFNLRDELVAHVELDVARR